MNIKKIEFNFRRTYESLLVAIFVLFTNFFVVAVTNAADFSNYRLGSGDRIQIHVYGEADLSVNVLLSDSGTINYPLLGELAVAGLTLGELQSKLVSGLQGDYLLNPSVQVAIQEYRPFFIHGEVQIPGGYPFQPGLTVSKAAALAQGFTDRASRSKIYIERQTEKGQEKIRAKDSTMLLPGDIITVEQSFF